MLDKAIRELDRERMGLQTQEKKLVGEIKAMAKKGQMVRLGAGFCSSSDPEPCTSGCPPSACQQSQLD